MVVNIDKTLLKEFPFIRSPIKKYGKPRHRSDKEIMEHMEYIAKLKNKAEKYGKEKT